MKKTVNRIIILTMSIFLLFGAIPISASAVTLVTDENFIGKVKSDNTLLLISYEGSQENVVVPSQIEGYTVSEIYRGCFFEEAYTQNIKTIYIPDGIYMESTDIPIMFQYCTNLEGFIIDLSNNEYSSVDGVLFNKDKTSLMSYPQNKSGESYTVPETVTYTYSETFYGNKNLKSLRLTSEKCSIENRTFYNMKVIENITLPNDVVSVGFYNCPTLKEVYFGKYIEEGKFYTEECPNLKFFVYKGSNAEKIAKENSIPYEYRTDTIVDEATGVTVTGVFDMNSILTVKSKTLEGTPKPVTQVLELSMTPSPEGELEISIPGLENQYIFEYTDGEYKIIPTTYSNNAYAFKTSNLGTYYISSSPNIIIPYSLGDVNGDGEITIDDATNIQVHLARIKELSTEGLSAADFNGDGKVNILDATYIRLYLAKIIVK